MLPIIRHHRKPAIPHRVAMAAAAVALLLSFTVDQASLRENLQADSGSPIQGTEQAEEKAASGAAASDRDSGSLQLSPWFLVLKRR